MVTACGKERNPEIKSNTTKTDILNRMGQVLRSNKLVVGALFFIVVVTGIGLGLEHANMVDRYLSAKKKRDIEPRLFVTNSRVSQPPQNGWDGDFDHRIRRTRAAWCIQRQDVV